MKSYPDNLKEMKIENINMIFDLVRQKEPISRTQLKEFTSLTAMSISRIVNFLVEQKFIVEKGEILEGRGRPAKKLLVHANKIRTLVVCFDVDCILLMIVNLKNEVLYRKSFEATSLISMEEYVDMVYDWVKKKRIDADVISFLCPGMIHPKTGEVFVSVQLNWNHVPLKEYAEKKFDQTIIVENDVKAALLGETSLMTMIEKTNVVYMDIGYGVGVGVMIDGHLLSGTRHQAGEIGHMVIDLNGKNCACGRKGCLNTVLNLESILKIIEKNKHSENHFDALQKAYIYGENWAKSLIDEIHTYVSIAIGNIVAAYDPEYIIIGGKLFQENKQILDNFIEKDISKGNLFYPSSLKIVSSVVGEKRYGVGGAICAQRKLLEMILS